MRTVKTDTLEIAYLDSGPANGWPVVLSHGFPYDPRGYDAIAPVLAQLFADPEFEASLGRRFKEPLLYVVSAARLAGDSVPVLDTAPLWSALGRLGQRPFGRQTPDGYPLDEASWAGAGQMVARFDVARALARAFAAQQDRKGLRSPGGDQLGTQWRISSGGQRSSRSG